MYVKRKYTFNFCWLLVAVALVMTDVWPAPIQNTAAQGTQNSGNNKMDRVKHLKDLQVIEIRRYDLKEDARQNFAQYFEAFFPEAFQQLGVMIFGQFFERKNPLRFTWIRGFRNMESRAIANSEFYYGPLWKEHSQTMNSLMVDVGNVLLLRPTEL
jgi:hypothetical protein